MTDSGMLAYFSVEGARLLLSPYENRTLPTDPKQWVPRLAPMIRALWNAEHGNDRRLYEVTDQLRRVARVLEDHHKDPLSVETLRKIPRTVPPGRTADVVREIAAYVDAWVSLPREETLHDVPPEPRELVFRFPRLSRFLPLCFGEDGIATEGDMEDASAEEGIQLWIGTVHPACFWTLPGVVAECAEAQALFHDEAALADFFSDTISGGSGEWDFTAFLPLVARLCTDHMKTHHPIHGPGPCRGEKTGSDRVPRK